MNVRLYRFITGFDGKRVVTIPFEGTVSHALKEETRQLPFFIPSCLTDLRHVELKRGDFFITEDEKNDGFWLYTPEGKRYFEAYQVEDNGRLIMFLKNRGNISVRRVDDLHAHTLRNPSTLVPVTA